MSKNRRFVPSLFPVHLDTGNAATRANQSLAPSVPSVPSRYATHARECLFGEEYWEPRGTPGTGNKYDPANLEAARVIAADPGRYPGLMNQWAARLLMRLAGRTEAA